MPTTGVNFLVYVRTSIDPDVWTRVAGQRGGTLNRARDVIDVTSKDSEGWIQNEYSFGNWGIDADGLVIEDDAGFLALEDALQNKEKVMVRFETNAGHQYEGMALVTDFPVDAPYDAEATYTVTLEGDGEPQKIDAT